MSRQRLKLKHCAKTSRFLNFVAIAFQLKECPDGGLGKVRFLASYSKTQK